MGGAFARTVARNKARAVRIVGGALRGRRLAAPDGRTVRPTADRAREGLFNILEHGAAFADFDIRGAIVVDAFAGTGALGLEALSRGAERVYFLENDPVALKTLRANVEALDQTDRAEILNRDATHPGRAQAQCDLAFLDPPYASDFAIAALAELGEQGWLATDAVVVVEHAADADLIVSHNFEPIEQRRYGAAHFAIFRWRANE